MLLKLVIFDLSKHFAFISKRMEKNLWIFFVGSLRIRPYFCVKGSYSRWFRVMTSWFQQEYMVYFQTSLKLVFAYLTVQIIGSKLVLYMYVLFSFSYEIISLQKLGDVFILLVNIISSSRLCSIKDFLLQIVKNATYINTEEFKWKSVLMY